MFKTFSAAALAMVCFFAADLDAQTQLDESRFEKLLATVVPSAETKLIDWHPDLLGAQKAAIAQKKPMFIWSMDGHPLGCT